MKKYNSKTGFWILYHLGLLLFSVITAIIIKHKHTGNAFDPTVIAVTLTIFLISTNIGYLATYMVNKFERYNQLQLTKKIIPGFILFYVFSYLVANIAIAITTFIWFLHLGRDLSEYWVHLFKYELHIEPGNFFLWLLIFTVVFFYGIWRKSVTKEQKLREENLKYKYQNLKSQVNPHFLFNSLNTLSEIIYEDTKKADAYIQKLSAIYRYILDNENTDLISLQKELEFVKQYFDLQKERDNGKIDLDINVTDSSSYKIIPVSLQLLVENALKHNSISEKGPLKIKIYREKDSIVVSNAILRKSTLENTPGTGLSNLKERVNLITNKELIVTEKNNEFTVQIPVIES